MKKTKLMIALLGGMVLAGASTAWAADEITITGDMVCGKCTLHETAKCQNVVEVKDGDKVIKYYLKENDVSKDAHDGVCHGDTGHVKVTGTVKDKDGKKMMTATKIEVVKS